MPVIGRENLITKLLPQSIFIKVCESSLCVIGKLPGLPEKMSGDVILARNNIYYVYSWLNMQNGKI